jgi:hypothetical protein
MVPEVEEASNRIRILGLIDPESLLATGIAFSPFVPEGNLNRYDKAGIAATEVGESLGA